jgi:hypothetical protein
LKKQFQLVKIVQLYQESPETRQIFDGSNIVCQVLFPVPKCRIFAKLGFVGTLTKTFECEFGELIRNLAIFQTFQISDCGKEIPIYFFVGMSDRQVNNYNFPKPLMFYQKTQKGKQVPKL